MSGPTSSLAAAPAAASSSSIDPLETTKLAASRRPTSLLLQLHEQQGEWERDRYYDWKTHFKRSNGSRCSILRFLRWLTNGVVKDAKQSDEEIQYNLTCLARMLVLLREYLDRFDMPTSVGPNDEEYVLRELVKDLYAGGVPIWALDAGMQMAAEGLTGKKNVDFFLLPRKAFIFAPSSGATTMFQTQRGFDIQRLHGAERILVRLASFASNTHGLASLPTRLPNEQELRLAFRTESVAEVVIDDPNEDSRAGMAQEILDLASNAEGLFFFINSNQRPDTKAGKKTNDGTEETELGETKEESHLDNGTVTYGSFLATPTDLFWTIEDDVAELFTKLATMEAIRMIDKTDEERKVLYSKAWILIFRFMSSAGACAFWFNGSWADIMVAGICGSMVGIIGMWHILTREERIIFEAVASFAVGVVAGAISSAWPQQTCFNAIAIAGVLDLLQGFRVVYAVIEIMSKHSVAGGADFLEGILYTGLVAYFLKLGHYTVTAIMGEPAEALECTNGISEWWYFFWVPVASLSWSGLFNPEYSDLPWMGFHGVLAFVVSWALDRTNINPDSGLYVAAVSVSFSAGLYSRFTGKNAIGCTVAGLYVLLPGAYLVTSLFDGQSLAFLSIVFFRAAVIGLGAWTGTILCSPTLFGATKGLLQNGLRPSRVGLSGRRSAGGSEVRRDKSVRQNGTGAMLFF